ncbi:MAG: PAS domain S-box protein [Candidatus Sumerlaeia bacterium]|nr:PAS domain S-box protein [Candidatus Sumerlaeia bacterium]
MERPRPRRVPLLLVAAFALLTAGIAWVGWLMYVHDREQDLEAAREQLWAVSNLKVQELSRWRQERLGNARVLAQSPLNSLAVAPYLAGRADASAEEGILAWMRSRMESYGYSGAVLLDLAGAVRLTTGAVDGQPDAEGLAALSEARERREPVFTRIHRSDGSSIHMGIAVPLLASPSHSVPPPLVGMLLLVLEPETHIYPLIEAWPGSSETAETLIVRQEGEDVVFLNDLRFRPGAALTLRASIGAEDLPAAMAARGHTGLVEGRDYRGVPVLAAIQGVPGFPWLLVAKVDQAEVLASLRARLWLLGGLIIALILLVGALVLLAWKRWETEAMRSERAVEQRLIESERRFRETLENVDLIALELDREGRVTFCNDHLLRLTGWTRDEVIGRDWFETFIPAGQRTELRRTFDDAMCLGTLPAHHENPIVTRTGELRQVRWNNILLRSPGGSVTGAASIAEDVTDHRRAAEELRVSEERLRAFFESDVVGTLLGDIHGGIEQANDEFLRIVGYTREDLESGRLRWTDLTPAEFLPIDWEHVREAQERGACTPYEKQYLRKDGSRIWVLVGYILHGPKRQHSVAFILDLTKAKEAEAANLELQQQLTQAQKMESIGRLAGGVAHDFNNMLQVILGYGDMLRAELPPSEGDEREAVDQILAAASRAKELTSRLLAFGRKQVLSIRHTDLGDVVRGIEPMLRRIIGEDIRVVLRGEPGLWPVAADPSQMDQVLLNLAVNARDAMPRGGTLSIETANVVLDEAHAATHVSESPGDHVLLAVGDTGCGMDEETRRHIFEPFFTTKGSGGTGLGLATVYGIVKQHGGHIWVYSEAGRGTTFKIYLPRAAGEAGASAAPLPAGAPLPAQGEVILVVEDNDQVREITRRMLEHQGYVLLLAGDAGEALRLAQEQGRIDLLLTDVILPGQSGRDLFEALTARRPGLRVLYMSGYSGTVIAHHGILDEATHFVQKPFTRDGLLHAVQRALAG